MSRIPDISSILTTPPQTGWDALREGPQPVRSALVDESLGTAKVDWKPHAGPQTQAYESSANELFYGGSAGGGKGLKCLTIPARLKQLGITDPREIAMLRDQEGRVLTPTGFKPVSEIAVGDRVCNPDGTVCEVAGVYDRPDQPFYKVTFIDGASVEVDENHLWPIVWAGKRKRRKDTIPTIPEGMRPSDEWNLRYFSRYSIVGTKELCQRFRELEADHDDGERAYWPIVPLCAPCRLSSGMGRYRMPPPYLYGVLLGDGNMTTSPVKWGKPDEQIANLVMEEIAREQLDWTIVRKDFTSCPVWYVRGTGDESPTKLCERAGLVGSCSHDKFIHQMYLNAPTEIRSAVVRGLMDTDGSADDRGHIDYISMSKQLALDLQYLCRSLGFAATLSEKECHYTLPGGGRVETGTGYRLYIKGSNTKSLFSLDRKRNRCRDDFNGGDVAPGRRITAITKAEPSPSRCIKVSHPNGLFITNDFIVTHNTSLIVALSLIRHHRSLILRRQAVQVTEIVDQLKRFATPGYSWRGLGHGGTMTTVDGRMVEVSGCDHEEEKTKYSGRPHDLICVGKSTPIRMADGSTKLVEYVQVGDWVDTLEGPRKVIQKHPPQVKPSVRLDVLENNALTDNVLYSQVQSSNHAVFFLHAWLSADTHIMQDLQLGVVFGSPALIAPFEKPSLVHPSLYFHPYRKWEMRKTDGRTGMRCKFRFTPVGDREVFDIAVEGANHYLTGIGVVNKNCFDEASFFSRSQVRYISAWNRHESRKQRCRIILTGNPPTSPEARWIIDEYAPWLDKDYPNPAKPGELRWYSVLKGKLTWLENSDPFDFEGEKVTPRSRTFIPARLTDNPILAATDYGAHLQSLDEPLRSQLLYGDMTVGLEEDAWQVIPEMWLRAAFKRWEANPPDKEKMTAMGVDVSRGGRDRTAIARRYGTWFAPLIKYPGTEIRDGQTARDKVLLAHEGDAPVHIDVIGIGASAYDQLKECGWFKTVPVNNAAGAQDFTDKTKRLKFRNVRAASYWRLREALDPINGDHLALCPDNELLVDLCAPRYKMQAGGILVESKDDIQKRIGRSTDLGDAVTLCWWTPRKLAGSVYVVPPTGLARQRTMLKIVACSRTDLLQLAFDHRVLLVTLAEPCEVPLEFEHGLHQLLDRLDLVVASIDPMDLQQTWDQPLERYGKLPVDVMFQQEQAKTLWRFLLKKREPAAEAIVLADDNNGVALSAAYGLADVLRLPRKMGVYVPGDESGAVHEKAPAPNAHVYRLLKATRGLIM